MSVRLPDSGLATPTVVALGLLFLCGIAIGLGHAVLVLLASIVLGVVAFWRGRPLDLLIAMGMLTISFSGIEIGPVTAPDLFLVPAAVVLGFRQVMSSNKGVPLWLVGSAGAILGAGLLAQIPFPNLPSRSLIILLQLCISLMYVPLVISLGVHSRRQLHHISAMFVASAAISAFFGFLEYVGISDVASRLGGFSGFAYNGGRPAGFTAHPNQLGLICVLAFPFAVELFRRSRLWAGALLVLVAGVMVSGSRTALVGLIVGALVILWIRGGISTARLMKGAVALAILGSMATLLGVDLALDRLLVDDRTVVEATEARTDSVRTAIDDIETHPLTGVGFGKDAHSLYLQLLQGAGVLALLGFGWFAQRTLRTAYSMRADPLASAAGASLVTWLVTGLVHPGLYERFLYVPAGIILGARLLAHKSGRISGSESERDLSDSHEGELAADPSFGGASGPATRPQGITAAASVERRRTHGTPRPPTHGLPSRFSWDSS